MRVNSKGSIWTSNCKEVTEDASTLDALGSVAFGRLVVRRRALSHVSRVVLPRGTKGVEEVKGNVANEGAEDGPCPGATMPVELVNDALLPGVVRAAGCPVVLVEIAVLV